MLGLAIKYMVPMLIVVVVMWMVVQLFSAQMTPVVDAWEWTNQMQQLNQAMH